MIDPEAEAFDGGEDVVGGFGPLEGLRVFVVLFDEGADVGFELAGRGVHTALQLLARQFGKPAFDLIDPGSGGRREVDVPVRSSRQPGLDRRGLVSGVVVHDDVDVQPLRDTPWTHPGKVEAPYTVCIASASNLTGLVKSSVECRRTGL